jgi:hypothetical protein
MRSPVNLLILCTILLAGPRTAVAARAEARVSRDSLTIGDRIQLTVSILTPAGARIDPPSTDEGLGQFVVKQWDTDTKQRDGSDSLIFRYVITTYTTGRCSIPSLPFTLTHEGQSDTLRTEPIPVHVVSVIPPTDSASLRDLKPPFSAGRRSLLWLWLLLGAAGIVAAIAGGRHLWRRARKPAPPPPPPPPYEEAVEALRRLESRDYPAKGMAREFVFELSEIIKRYAGRRFDVNAPEFTTDELLEWVESSQLEHKERGILEWLFKTAHPVKFARLVPERSTLERMGEETWTFLESTRPRPETEKTREHATEGSER